MNRHNKQQAGLVELGFTLIEVLIAISLLALVMTVGYSSLSHILRGKRLLDDYRDTAAIGNSALLRLCRELQLAYNDGRSSLITPPDQPSEPSSASVVLEGESNSLDNNARADRITFLALEGGQYLPDGGSHTGVVQITYRVEPNPEETDSMNPSYYLIRDEIPYLRPAEKAYKQRMTFPITSRLVELSFDYFDADKQQWVQTWGRSGQKKLPLLIRFSLGIRSPTGRVERYATMISLRNELE